jgi:outer membrane lipoprotein-sorting protein
MRRLYRYRVVIALLLVLPSSGCLFRSHKVQRQPGTTQLKSTSGPQLIDYINTQAEKIKTLQATVDIDTAVGGVKKGKVTEYQEIRGYVLARKPAMLRMIGLMPVVRNRAFDMVSDGEQFKLWIPPKNKFIVGHNQVTHESANPLENVRPQHIYDALLLRHIDAENEIAVVESGEETIRTSSNVEITEPDYTVDVIRKGEHGWYLFRKITFSRTDLLPHRQRIYDEQGDLATDAHYDDFQDYDGINFPNRIEIWRPGEEYTIILKMVKLKLNDTLTDEQFALQRPPNADFVNLDQQRPTRASDGKQPERRNLP